MNISLIPIQAIPSQLLTVQLNGYRCQISIYEKRRYPFDASPSAAIYVNIYLNNVSILAGALVRDSQPIVQQAYLGFPGDLAFIDMNGNDDPQTSGLGTRWILAYLS